MSTSFYDQAKTLEDRFCRRCLREEGWTPEPDKENGCPLINGFMNQSAKDDRFPQSWVRVGCGEDLKCLEYLEVSK